MNPLEEFGPILLLIGVPLITGFLADRKGYNFFLWMLAGGCIGLVILAFLPKVSDVAGCEDELEETRKRGNIIGAVLAGISILLLLVRGGLGF